MQKILNASKTEPTRSLKSGMECIDRTGTKLMHLIEVIAISHKEVATVYFCAQIQKVYTFFADLINAVFVEVILSFLKHMHGGIFTLDDQCHYDTYHDI